LNYEILLIRNGAGVLSTFDRSMEQQGCDPNGKFAVIVHGWKEGSDTPWVIALIKNLLATRGGCVIFMDFSKYSKVSNYFTLTPHFDGISAVLLKKLKQINAPDRTYMFGFSFGSRLCTEAGFDFANETGTFIDSMDLCDPAGPGFTDSTVKDPKLGGKNVRCINTSTDKGTDKYNCHRNFRMGTCGIIQPGASAPPMGNHGLCPYFFVNSFVNNFAVNNSFAAGCVVKKLATNIPVDLKMGYSEAAIA